MSLALLSHLCSLKYQLVDELLFEKIQQIAQFNWWENKCIAIVIFCKIVTAITQSEMYQLHLKNLQNQKLITLENEKAMAEMGSKVK